MEIIDKKQTKDKLILYLEDHTKFFVPIGTGFDPNTIKPFSYYKEKYESYNHALATEQCLCYLTHAMRTKQECILHLQKKGFYAPSIQAALQRVEALGYLDDMHYSTEYVKTKALLENVGPLKIKAGLTRKGIDPEIIEKALLSYDDAMRQDRIQKLLEKLNAKYNSLPQRVRQNKCKQALLAKGFAFEDFYQALSRQTPQQDKNEEYEKQKRYFAEKIKRKAQQLIKKDLSEKEIRTRLYSTFIPQGVQSTLIDESMESGTIETHEKNQ